MAILLSLTLLFSSEVAFSNFGEEWNWENALILPYDKTFLKAVRLKEINVSIIWTATYHLTEGLYWYQIGSFSWSCENFPVWSVHVQINCSGIQTCSFPVQLQLYKQLSYAAKAFYIHAAVFYNIHNTILLFALLIVGALRSPSGLPSGFRRPALNAVGPGSSKTAYPLLLL